MTVRRLVALCLAIVILLSACVPAPSPEAPVAITFAIPETMPRAAQASLQSLVEAFNGTEPGFAVQLQAYSLDGLPQGLAGAGWLSDPERGVDVLLAGADLLSALVQAGLVRDLQPALDAGGTLPAGDVPMPVLDLVRWQGNVYGLPLEVDPWVLFYNRDLFDAAGVAYPAAGWGWDGFLATARALAASGAVPFPFGSPGAQVTPFVYQNGGTLLDDPLAPTMATLLDPATVEAVRWYTGLALAEGVMPTPADLAGYATGVGRRQTIIRAGDEAETAAAQARADLEQAVAAGDVAMWLGRLSEREGRWAREGFAWGIVPLPAGKSGQSGQAEGIPRAATLAGVQACFVTAHAKYPDQALQWIDHLSRQPALHGGLPARRSTAEGDATRARLGLEVEAALDDLLLALENGAVLPESLDWQATRWLSGPLFAVLAGEQTVEEALAAAQQRAEAELGQNGR